MLHHKVSIFNKHGLIIAGLLSLLFPMMAYAQTHGINTNPEIYATYPKIDYGTGAERELIKRGEYLTKAGDCIACHTDTQSQGAAFAGGAAIKTPFGSFYGPNITPDKKYGIGSWSDKDFIRAMHEGKMPNGQNHFPVFPYPDFNRVSESDILAIRAYLNRVPAVHKPARENYVSWPFSWRFLQYGWKLLFFEFQKGQFQYQPTHSKEWNRGAYLVEGLAHCGMCHTPHNIMGGEKKAYAYTGGFVDGYYAPDISSTGLANASIEDVVAVFKEDKKLNGGGKVGGPMAEVNHDSLQYLTDEDLRAIAVYLKTVKSKSPAGASTSGGAITADTGKNLYVDKCAVCHDSGAAGAPKLNDQADWANRFKIGEALVLEHAIKGYNSMPPKGTCMTCSDAEIKAIVDYIRIESKADAAGAASGLPKGPVKPTLADGKRVYEKNCSVCHAAGQFGAPKLGDKQAWQPRIKQNMDILFDHAIYGYKKMPAIKNSCQCSNTDIIAAVKYMVQESKTSGDYSLW